MTYSPYLSPSDLDSMYEPTEVKVQCKNEDCQEIYWIDYSAFKKNESCKYCESEVNVIDNDY